MSSTTQPSTDHPIHFHSPGWHSSARTPVVDNKYYDPTTGELRYAPQYTSYQGPPAVDIIIQSIHEDTSHCVQRAARPFPMEAILSQIMHVVRERRLSIDSLTATPYAVRLILTHELTAEEFGEVTDSMVNGCFREERLGGNEQV